MSNNKEKSANRKALPKFFLIIAVSMVCGLFLGVVVGFLGAENMPEQVVEAIYYVLGIITPWAIWVSTAVLMAAALVKYCGAKRLYTQWDGEDEESIEQADRCLSWALLFSAVNLILDFFFFGIAGQVVEGGLTMILAGFAVSMVVVILMQQKIIDLTRRMNPEKQGSVYDMKFKDKWLASCDENELRQVGQAALKAFGAVTNVCVGLWMVLVILGGVMDIGILPIFLVMLIWAVSQITYTLACIHMDEKK